MATIAEQLAAYEAKRAANVASMKSIMDKSGDEGATLDAAQQEEFDTLNDDNEAIDKHLDRLRVMEKVNRKAPRRSKAATADPAPLPAAARLSRSRPRRSRKAPTSSACFRPSSWAASTAIIPPISRSLARLGRRYRQCPAHAARHHREGGGHRWCHDRLRLGRRAGDLPEPAAGVHRTAASEDHHRPHPRHSPGAFQYQGAARDR
jgi:hypothetical protein